MIIWLIALIILVASAVLGYTLGAVRVGITTIGLLFGTFLAMPMAPLFHMPIEKLGGSKLHALFIAPVISIILVVSVFKILGGFVHRKLDAYYKYKTADYVQTLWLRTNERFGAALSVVNATIYVYLVCVFISVIAYPVAQLSSGESDSKAWQYLMKASEALQTTHMDKAAAAFDPASPKYYHVCDMLGMVYQNPLLVGRLTTYPRIMALGERPEFEPMFADIAKDNTLAKKLYETPRPPFQELLAEPALQNVLTNRAFIAELFKLNYKDLSNYLATAKSDDLTDDILGRWQYDFEASVKAQKARINELAGGKIKWNSVIGRTVESNILSGFKSTFESATMVCLISNKMVIKATTPGRGTTAARGTWSSLGAGKYELALEGDGSWSKEVEMRGSRIKAKIKVGNEKEPRIVIFEQE